MRANLKLEIGFFSALALFLPQSPIAPMNVFGNCAENPTAEVQEIFTVANPIKFKTGDISTANERLDNLDHVVKESVKAVQEKLKIRIEEGEEQRLIRHLEENSVATEEAAQIARKKIQQVTKMLQDEPGWVVAPYVSAELRDIFPRGTSVVLIDPMDSFGARENPDAVKKNRETINGILKTLYPDKELRVEKLGVQAVGLDARAGLEGIKGFVSPFPFQGPDWEWGVRWNQEFPKIPVFPLRLKIRGASLAFQRSIESVFGSWRNAYFYSNFRDRSGKAVSDETVYEEMFHTIDHIEEIPAISIEAAKIEDDYWADRKKQNLERHQEFLEQLKQLKDSAYYKLLSDLSPTLELSKENIDTELWRTVDQSFLGYYDYATRLSEMSAMDCGRKTGVEIT